MPSIEELERIAGDPARPYDERVDAAEKIVTEIGADNPNFARRCPITRPERKPQGCLGETPSD